MNTPDSFHFDCPFCGRDVHVVTDASKHVEFLGRAPKNDQAPAILHRLPECNKFKKLEPTRFLEEARKAIAASGPS